MVSWSYSYLPPTVLPLGSLPSTEDASSPSMGEGSCPVGEVGNLLSGPLLFSWVSWLLSSGEEREKMPQVLKSASLKGDLITRPPCLYQDHKPPWQVHMDQKGHSLKHRALFKCRPGLLPPQGPAKMALERISIYGDTGTKAEWPPSIVQLPSTEHKHFAMQATNSLDDF